jgi:hypothetical protein
MRLLLKHIAPLRGILLAAAALTGLASAQTGLTTIQDTLYKADGTRFRGTLIIQWSTFDATNIGTIVQQSKSVQVVNGNLEVQLVPNAGVQAPANVYTVHYQSDASQQFTETWSVPASAVPLTVAEVRTGMLISTGGTGTGSTTGSQTPIPESSVTGLVTDLGQRPTKGPLFGTGSVAFIDDNGQIETSVGNVGDCVFVDGTTGPCGSQSSTFFDAETPGGLVDGNNTTFTLANAPSGSSLMLFRNGLYMSANFDYTLSGSTITFASGAQPQPGDTIIGSYRIDPSSGDIALVQTGAGRSAAMAQVLCSANGRSTNLASWTSLGACDIPSAALSPGDRIEVRFGYSHTGTASGFDVQINWGNTTILARHGGTQDAAFAGQAEAAVTSNGAQVTVQSWGTVLSFLPAIVNAPAQSGVRVDLRGQISTAGGDSLALTSYTVLLYPGH